MLRSDFCSYVISFNAGWHLCVYAQHPKKTVTYQLIIFSSGQHVLKYIQQITALVVLGSVFLIL